MCMYINIYIYIYSRPFSFKHLPWRPRCPIASRCRISAHALQLLRRRWRATVVSEAPRICSASLRCSTPLHARSQVPDATSATTPTAPAQTSRKPGPFRHGVASIPKWFWQLNQINLVQWFSYNSLWHGRSICFFDYSDLHSERYWNSSRSRCD